jgi:ribonuclease P protein component
MEGMMIKRDNRMTRGNFRSAMKKTRRKSGALFVVMFKEIDEPTRVGIVTSRAVGNAVMRNARRRQVRAILADWVSANPQGVSLVIQARPEAATATFQEMSNELNRLVKAVTR